MKKTVLGFAVTLSMIGGMIGSASACVAKFNSAPSVCAISCNKAYFPNIWKYTKCFVSSADIELQVPYSVIT